MKRIWNITFCVAAIAAFLLFITMNVPFPKEVQAVIVGAVCGVAAGIPTSILLLVILCQQDAIKARKQ